MWSLRKPSYSTPEPPHPVTTKTDTTQHTGSFDLLEMQIGHMSHMEGLLAGPSMGRAFLDVTFTFTEGLRTGHTPTQPSHI